VTPAIADGVSVFCHRADDIALGQNANETPARIENDQHPDLAFL
jgi:hypothetical protein